MEGEKLKGSGRAMQKAKNIVAQNQEDSVQDQEIVHADMSVCTPAEAMAREWGPGTWRLVDYETEYGLEGTMVYADPELGAPTLELPLNASGFYKIYLGINYTKSRYHYQKYSPYGHIDVKLTDDSGFRHVGAEDAILQPDATSRGLPTMKLGKGQFIPRSIQEVYWKTADLTGQSLLFRPMDEPYNNEKWRGIANLSYVRLVPLDPQEMEAWQQLQPRDDTRCLAFIYCTGNLSGNIDEGPGDYHPTSMDWFRHEIQPCLDSDISILNVEAIRGSYCTFHTQIGDVGGKDNTWQAEWVDPLAAFTQLAHENGLRLFGAMRMIGAAYPATREPLGRASFYWAHPEWAKRDRRGIPTSNLSIAYSQVRAYWLSLLREVLDYGVDGITVYLHRFYPFVLYEDPVVEAFQARFGEDPRGLPRRDQRWLQHCADYVTQFLREVRELVNQEPGRQVAVIFNGGPSPYERDPENWHPIQCNYDVEAWIREGLVDYLWPAEFPPLSRIKAWRELGQGRVHIWPDLTPALGPQATSEPGAKFAKQAQVYYEAGADGFCLWDADRKASRISEWSVQCRLGHREMLDYLAQKAPTDWQRVPLRQLMGMSLRYSFNNYDFPDPLTEEKD